MTIQDHHGFLLRLARQLDAEAGWPPDCGLVAGVSGGRDSMVMLSFLTWYAQRHDRQLLAAHLDHGLRGPEGAADAQLVGDWCAHHGVRFVSETAAVSHLAKQRQRGLEEAGRVARRAFFSRLAERWRAEATGPATVRIALAHHQGDQAESVLLHLGRGSGLAGLAGMSYFADGLLRPLIDQPEADIQQFAEAGGLSWREDASNQTREFLRNRLRLDVLPAWASAIGTDPVPLLARLADSVREDQAALEAYAAQALRQASLEDGALNCTPLKTKPAAVLHRVLRIAYDRAVGTTENLGRVHLLALAELVRRAPASARLDLPHRCQARLRRNKLSFSLASDSEIGIIAQYGKSQVETVE